MNIELNLNFSTPEKITVFFDGDSTDFSFENPIQDEERDEIRRYLENYPVQYMTDIDDGFARKLEERLPEIGARLFRAAFSDDVAKRLFDRFQDEEEPGRLITVSASHPDILSLPWELLRDPRSDAYLCNENPRISIRRRLSRAGGGRARKKAKPKDTLHLLFVVSRPNDAGFIDPRADPEAVMDALDAAAPGRVTTEFLRPATLEALVERLEDTDLPAVDILHFDGHGAYDPDGRFSDEAQKDSAAIDELFANADLRARKEEIQAGNVGYLLFEKEDGKRNLVPAGKLGEMLNRQKVSLVVLSACQSAKMGGDDAMGSVSARLTHAGIPAVLAMTHSVLVATTRMLFGEFYKNLGKGKPVGESLDNARRFLQMRPERGERPRGRGMVTLELQDWFLPALYQAGADRPLLRKGEGTAAGPSAETGDGLPKPESGFHGRAVELWLIERAFLGGTRRITATGFGGQGKTALAAEAGRWLVRSGLFRRCCFVSFAAFQGVDPVAFAVSSLSVALDRSLIDAAAAEAALAEVPTLVILDNLESLTDGDEDRQTPLLDAAARWSRAGESRVLITTRQPKLDHPEFPAAGSREHQYLGLSGLAEPDAVRLFAALWELPPSPEGHIEGPPPRHGLVALFQQVDFHPLSIGLLAYQLKSRRAAELGERLESLLKDAPGEGAEKNLRASLDLSLERLPAEARKWLPRLGVFRGGGMEDVILQVTALGKVDEAPEVAFARKAIQGFRQGDQESIAMVKAFGAKMGKTDEEVIASLEAELAKHQQSDLAEGTDESTWPALRQALETAGLVRLERLEGVAAPFLKFHPALAPALWERLPEADRADLAARHRAVYYRLSGKLYHQDDREPHAARAVARRELPNLLFAVKAALAAGDEDAVQFVDRVNKFLGNFGLLRDRDDLNQRAETAAGPGSRAWFLAQSNKGEALYAAGRHREAEGVFRDILNTMGETPTYERCLTLGRIGRCLEASGRTGEAAATYREGIAVAEKLEQSDGVRRQTGALQTDLADALRDMGDFAGARAAYEAGLEIDQELGDERGAATSQFQLGTLAMHEGNLAEAERRYQEALQTFRRLNEPASEATVQHQLGYLYDEAKQWDAAEAAYRESARLKESQGNLAGAVQTYNNLGNTMNNAGRREEAETWYRRALEGRRKVGDRAGEARTANNLADLLQNDPARLPEARQLAEQALAIKKTLDPGAASIWNAYTILAQIADKQAAQDGIGAAEKAKLEAEAREHRRLGREARSAFMGTQHQLKPLLPLVKLIADAANGNEQSREMAEKLVAGLKDQAANNPEAIQLFEAMERILAGEREIENLDDLNSGVALILQQILEAVKNPESLKALLDEAESQSDQPEKNEEAGPSIPQQHAQIALAAALPAIHPDARAQVEPILDQLTQAGFTALAAILPRIWNGERDPAALCADLNENDTATVHLALHLIEHPEELAKMMGG